MTQSHADILIVCGQGVYDDGIYAAEYDDRDVYIDHAIGVRDVVARFRYTDVVCSGGYTQPGLRNVSEAMSFCSMWKDTRSTPEDARVWLDEYALDSAENVLIGLMAARRQLGGAPIRRVGVFSAWDFKKKRFNSVARELGIQRSFYFHGFAGADRANAGEQALKGEASFLDKIALENDALLLSSVAVGGEAVRIRRFCGDPEEDEYDKRLVMYPERLASLRIAFPQVFAAIDSLKSGRDANKMNALQVAFRSYVMLE